MRKIVIDTSVLIDDVRVWKNFGEGDEIQIPVCVLTELDKLKKQFGEVGKAARVCIRLLDEESEKGDISVGILLDSGALLKIDATYHDLKEDRFQGLGDPHYGDTQILAHLVFLTGECPNDDVLLLSNDINLRMKAKSRGIEASSHDGRVRVSDQHMGYKVIDDLETFLKLKDDELCVSDLPEGLEIGLNEGICVEVDDGEKEVEIIGRRVSKDKIKLVKKNSVWDVFPRNREQTLALDMLLDKDLDLITLTGLAGSGKSLIVLAASLELILERKAYSKLIVYRPIQSVGNDIGFIPGDLSEKLQPHFLAVVDTLSLLLGNKKGVNWKKNLDELIKRGTIEFGAIPFIRGRNITNSIVFLDESQNISQQDMKTILTRVGEGTKMVLSGDIEQIDRGDLDAGNNGLSYVIEKFKNSEIAGHITFIEGERSKLATLAAKIL